MAGLELRQGNRGLDLRLGFHAPVGQTVADLAPYTVARLAPYTVADLDRGTFLRLYLGQRTVPLYVGVPAPSGLVEGLNAYTVADLAPYTVAQLEVL